MPSSNQHFFPSGFYRGEEVIWEGDNTLADFGRGIPMPGVRGTYWFYDIVNRSSQIAWHQWPNTTNDSQLTLWVAREQLCHLRHVEPEREENTVCANCGQLIGKDAPAKFVPGEGWVCDDCIETEYFVCFDCGRYVSSEEEEVVYTSTGEESICRACAANTEKYFRCEHCDNLYRIGATRRSRTGAGGWVCFECISEYRTCDECDNLYLWDDLETMPDDRELCASCAEHFRRRSIHNYSYKPNPKYKVKHKSDQIDTDMNIHELLFGVELEIDRGYDPGACSSELAQNTDVYCKHDGSLGGNGIEIVSHPCTLSYHLNELGWDSLMETAKRYGYSSHNAKTCGLHVHIGRRQLEDGSGEDNAAKLVLAVDRHWGNLVTFSRRTESQLCHWASRNDLDLEDAFDERTLLDIALETENEGRYQAVNLTNDKTVEIRIFRGTLELSTFKATLELVSNFCEYVKKHTALEVMNSEWLDIAYFKEYPELNNYLIDKGLAQATLLPTLPSWDFPERPPEPVRFNEVTDDMLAEDTGWDASYPHLRRQYVFGFDTSNDVCDFHEGDYVIVTNNGTYDLSAQFGRVGRVVLVRSDNCLVRFSEEDNGGFHDGRSTLPDNTGYFIKHKHLARYSASVRPTILLPDEEMEGHLVQDMDFLFEEVPQPDLAF